MFLPRMVKLAIRMRLAMVVLLCGLFAASSDTALPPYASDKPITEPRLFGEGVFSTPYDEFGLAFASDGRTAFFNRSVPRSNLYFICTSTFERGHWTIPQVAPFSGQYWDFDAVPSPDGSRIFFGSDRPISGRTRPDQDFNIWMVEKTASGWSVPRPLEETVNSAEDETFASAAANGTLYFISGRDGGRQHLAIYRSKLVDGRYQPAEKLKGPVNDAENWSLEVLVAPDESYLLLVPFGRKDGFGSFDIYVSQQRDGQWTLPRNLGPKINTAARDYSPRFSPDGKYLFWASERGFERPEDYRELSMRMHRTLNGWGNIYQIELSAVGLGMKR